MILKSFKTFLGLLIFASLFTNLYSEEEIDIWKNKKEKLPNISRENEISNQKKNNNINIDQKSETGQKIKIEDNLTSKAEDIKIFGVHDPADYNFNLNMWSSNNGEDVILKD